MYAKISRSLAIFRLALIFVYDYWRIRRIERKYQGSQRDEAVARIYAQAGARVRRAAFRLEGLIVKVGQFLSARSDVLPTAFTRELTQLQDAVPSAPPAAIRAQLVNELGADIEAVFTSFETEPIAAASLGQVHRASLNDGQVVAVKVQRPGIERLARTDLGALRQVVGVAYRFTRFARRMNLPAIYREFEHMVHQELDYRMEADNLRRFRKQYADNKQLVIPGIVDALVTKRILVMEYLHGHKITDLAQYEKWDVSREKMAQLLVETYSYQLLVGGFIHADPHPGNLMILPDGRLGIVDFGMMSDIPRRDVETVARLVKAAIVQDVDTVVDAIDDLGFLQPHANRAFLRKAVGFMIDRIGGLELRKGPELDSFINEFEEFIHDEPLIIQAKYMFLGRALGMLAGNISTLDPGLDWFEVLKAKALPLLSQDSADPKDWRGRLKYLIRDIFGETAASATDIVLNQLQDTGLSLLRSPGLLERVLRKADNDELTVKLELGEVMDRLDRQDRFLRRSGWIVSALVSASAGLWMKYHNWLFLSYLMFAATVIFLLAAWKAGRKRKKSGFGPPHRSR